MNEDKNGVKVNRRGREGAEKEEEEEDGGGD